MSCVGASICPEGLQAQRLYQSHRVPLHNIPERPERTFAQLSKVTGFSQKAPGHVSNEWILYPPHTEAGLSLCASEGETEALGHGTCHRGPG